MIASAQDRANATARCPGSFEEGRKLPAGMMRCARCSFEFCPITETPSAPGEAVVALWHRAVRHP